MIMTIPPRTMVFRRPNQSPTHKFDRAPTRQPISYIEHEVCMAVIGSLGAYINRDNKTLEGRMIRRIAVARNNLGEHVLKLQWRIS